MRRPWAFRVLEEPAEGLPAVAAVDAAAHVLDDGASWCVAVRTLCAVYPGPPAGPATKVVRVDPEGATEYLRTAGVEADAHGIERFAGALCALHEYEAARAALDALPSGGMLLLDGALRGLGETAARFVTRLETTARERGVHVVGVVRNSGLQHDGESLLTLLRVAGVADHPGEAWTATVEADVHACLLEPRASRAYRVDTAEPEALPHLLRLARDQDHLGYPYPLAVARRRVAWTPEHVAAVRAGST